ncbi:MAG: DUF1003 domain-containing protein [Acaryochloris sp. RU_4_1]|nr:DUF1003 domain-containing protein [Acaryochloris sp. RU_4_1]NJR54217.1 DUF1003 domain-containing protein [Acaryochloris sp. CRU_2_0]
MNRQRPMRARVSPEEYQLLQRLRERKPAQNPPKRMRSLGDRVADQVAAVMGSWRFIIIQSIILALWVILNIVAVIQHWDPYPFILLNLMLSFQAAYAAPIIMMSQNRQAAIDRADAKHDYEVNQKAELEIELLQDKLTLVLDEEMVELKTLLIEQQQHIQRLETFLVEQFQK